MSLTKDSDVCKPLAEIQTLARSLCELVGKAADSGQPLYETEVGVLQHVLLIGRKAMDAPSLRCRAKVIWANR